MKKLSITENRANVSLCVVVAVLFWARRWLKRLELPHPSTRDILEKTGVSRSRAFELAQRVPTIIEGLSLPRGRPLKPKTVSPPSAVEEILRRARDYVYEHPGCVHKGKRRFHFDDGFKLIVLSQLDEHPEVDRKSVADAIGIPESTLAQWQKTPGKDHGATLEQAPTKEREPTLGVAHCETILHEWSKWRGGFLNFCEHIKQRLRIPLGRTAISSILEAARERNPKRRQGRSPDEVALRGAFETFFPNAQWCGDGAIVPVSVDGRRYVLNLEMNVDTYSGAFVGAHVSKAEDSDAVINAFNDSRDATETSPIAIVLDSKPSNHTDKVEAALEDTFIIRATPGRPQNKAHIEGGFGLLKPTLDNIEIDTSSKWNLAVSVLSALVTVWGRTINHRPRRDRQGRSRSDIISDNPSHEDMEKARKALLERQRRQEKARQTRAQRLDPVARELIQSGLPRLRLDDPGGHFTLALARYPLNVIIDSISIYEGKMNAGSLPKTADERYLLGIAKNIADERESWEIAVALWRARVEAGDLFCRNLSRKRRNLDELYESPQIIAQACIQEALDADAHFARRFWTDEAANLIANLQGRENVYLSLARNIARSTSSTKTNRIEILRILSEKANPC